MSHLFSASASGPLSLPTWAGIALEKFSLTPAKHHLLLLNRLEALAAGDIKRLLVLMPPGSAKSTYSSVIFPCWWLSRFPTSSVLAACHTASLAGHFGRRVRAMLSENRTVLNLEPARDLRSATSFATLQGGEYFATGVRGPVTGRRADLALIDDPVKSRAEAESALSRDFLYDWYRAELLTRLKPKAPLVLVMTRWHQDDLGGRISEAVKAGHEEWEILRLPALAEENDPLNRKIGEALWPEWESEADLQKRRLSLGEYSFAALYQQSPRPLSGGLFRPERLQNISQIPPLIKTVRAWDLAATAALNGNNPDWTVGLKLGLTENGLFVIQDIVRLRAGPYQTEKAISETAAKDGKQTLIGLPQDPGQAGKAQISYLTRLLAGFTVKASPESGSKTLRAGPVASQVEAGNMLLLQAPWNRAFIEEMRDFPTGAKDDQIDALSRAFFLLNDSPSTLRRAFIPLLPR